MASNAATRDHGTPAGDLSLSFQTYFVQQHARYLRIVIARRHMRREQFQLLRVALIVEDLNALRPACLRRAVQFAQITDAVLCCGRAAAETFCTDRVMMRSAFQEAGVHCIVAFKNHC